MNGLIVSVAVLCCPTIADAQPNTQNSTPLSLSNVADIAFTPDSKHVVMLDRLGNLSKLELPLGTPRTSSPVTRIGGSVRAIGAKLSRWAEFATLGTDTYADRNAPSVWNLSDGTQRKFPGFQWLVLSPDNRTAVGRKNLSYDAAVLNVETSAVISVLKGEGGQEIITAAISPDGRYVATGHHQGIVQLWDLSSGLPLRVLGNWHQGISVVSFGPDGKNVVAGMSHTSTSFDEPDLLIREVSTGNTDNMYSATHLGYDGWPTSVAFTDDGHWMIAGHNQGAVIIYDVFVGDPACVLRDFGISNVGPIVSVGFSTNTSYAFAVRSDGLAKVWDARGCLVKYVYKDELAKERTKSPLFAPKSEFETTEQFSLRSARAKEFEVELVKRFDARYDADLQAKANALQKTIKASITPVALTIQDVGAYDADKQVFPVKINGNTEIVKVPIAEAPAFKAGYRSAKVSGMKRPKPILILFEYYNIQISHPTTGTKYAFGRQE